MGFKWMLEAFSELKMAVTGAAGAVAATRGARFRAQGLREAARGVEALETHEQHGVGARCGDKAT